jgi:hypothetical protein
MRMGHTLRTIPTGGRDTPDTGMGTAGATGRRQQLLIWANGPHMNSVGAPFMQSHRMSGHSRECANRLLTKT